MFLAISIVFVMILLIFSFVFYTLAKPNYKKPIIDINRSEQGLSDFVLTENHLSYILAEIGFYQTHNPPLSSETPKINIKADDDWYSSEVGKGQIHTKKDAFENPDLIIYTSSEEILQAINSEQVEEYMKNSVAQGTTTLELKANYATLFSKGYLPLYKELTGESFTGSAIKIFSQG